MLQARHLNVRRGGRSVLADVNFTIAPGRLTVVVGPNGAGKSTLLAALAGDLTPDGGDVLLGDVAIGSMPPSTLARRRAVLPQSSRLAFPFTVHEVVSLGLAAGGRRTDDPGHVAEALAAVDLAGFAGRLYQELSGGEQQRVQLARVLCQIPDPVTHHGPSCLLLDEPVSGLDIRHQLSLMEAARDYAARGGAVMAVLHDLNLAGAFADRVAVVSDGRVAAEGMPGDVLTPATLADVFGLDHAAAARWVRLSA